MKHICQPIYLNPEEITGNVYFIQMDIIGPIKIGFAKNPKQRLTELQVSNPYQLRLIGYYPCGREHESEWHNAFSDICLQGEWFLPHPQLIEEIKQQIKMFNFFEKTGHIFKKYHLSWRRLGIERYWKSCPLLYQVWRSEMDEAKQNEEKTNEAM